MAAVVVPTSNLNSFTTTAAAEAVVAIVYFPNNDPSGGFNINGAIAFSTINAATTVLAVKVRQATFSGGNVVVAAPAGTQIGNTFSLAQTAGTATAAVIPFNVTDFAPVEVSTEAAVPTQAQSVNQPGIIPQGGNLYVITVTSTTNVATVAVGAANAVGIELADSQ